MQRWSYSCNGIQGNQGRCAGVANVYISSSFIGLAKISFSLFTGVAKINILFLHCQSRAIDPPDSSVLEE